MSGCAKNYDLHPSTGGDRVGHGRDEGQKKPVFELSSENN
jgi:hypothetical protein